MDDLIPQVVPHVPLVAQNLVLKEPSATPTKALIDSQYTHKNTYGDTVDMRLPEEHVVDNFVGDGEKVKRFREPSNFGHLYCPYCLLHWGWATVKAMLKQTFVMC
ncbi:hypothetical protein AgCh_030850 [Apium graveolens]